MAIIKCCIFKNLFDFLHFVYSHIYQINDNFNVLGVDFGTKKLGFAVANIRDEIAFPKDVLIGNWRDINTCLETILNYIEKFKVKVLVIGYPLKTDFTLSDNCLIILDIVRKISEYFQQKNIVFPILLFDERFSTKATWSDINYTRKKQKNHKYNILNVGFDDDKSACLMLNEVLQVFSTKVKQHSLP